MRSQQVRPTLGRTAHVLALGLLGLLASHAPRAHADAAPPAGPAPERRVTIDAFDLVAGDKQRVPKPSDQPRHKPDSSPPASSGSGDDDESSACFENCFVGGGPSESTEPPPARQAAVAMTRTWTVGDHGWLRAALPGDSLALRAVAWSPAHPESVFARLPDRAEVVVIETHALESGFELRVRPIDALEPAGWLPASLVSSERPAPSVAAPAAPESPFRPARPRDLWGIQCVIGGTVPLTRDLSREYDDGGLHVELNAVRTLGPKASWSAGFGFRSMAGGPEVMYVTPTVWEVPVRSRLEVYDFAVQIRGHDGTARSRWLMGLGPALFLVHERATVDTYTPAMVPTGRYRASLVRPAGGAVAHVGAALRTSRGFEFGLLLAACAMPWTGHEDESLTSDFVRAGLYQFDFGLTFTYPTH